MDLIKSTFADSKAEVELVIKAVSINLLPPPVQQVQLYLTFVRDGKLMFSTGKHWLQPSQAPGMTKLAFGDLDVFKTVNKYYGDKNRKWEAKEVTVNVISEGTGGKIQNIGTSKFNLANFVTKYFNSPEGEQQQTQFMEYVSYPPKGLVGDLELKVTLTPPSKDKIRGRSTGRQPVTSSNAMNAPPQPKQSFAGNNGGGVSLGNQKVLQQQIPLPQQPAANGFISIQYTFIPNFISFQGKIRPQKAYLKFFDGTKRELRTGDYWILPNSQYENKGGSPDDASVNFANEIVTGVLQIQKDA